MVSGFKGLRVSWTYSLIAVSLNEGVVGSYWGLKGVLTGGGEDGVLPTGGVVGVGTLKRGIGIPSTWAGGTPPGVVGGGEGLVIEACMMHVVWLCPLRKAELPRSPCQAG